MRITLKKPHSDGTVAVDMDPLSLLSRLATSVPPPRFHTVRYVGVLAVASTWRPRITPAPPEVPKAKGEPDQTEPTDQPGRKRPGGGYRPWAELLARTFAVDVLACPTCHGRMRLQRSARRAEPAPAHPAGAGPRPRAEAQSGVASAVESPPRPPAPPREAQRGSARLSEGSG